MPRPRPHPQANHPNQTIPGLNQPANWDSYSQNTLQTHGIKPHQALRLHRQHLPHPSRQPGGPGRTPTHPSTHAVQSSCSGTLCSPLVHASQSVRWCWWSRTTFLPRKRGRLPVGQTPQLGFASVACSAARCVRVRCANRPSTQERTSGPNAMPLNHNPLLRRTKTVPAEEWHPLCGNCCPAVCCAC